MPAKTLLIGLDGADHNLIDRMIDASELPNFAALRARLVAQEVENDPGQGNGQFWTSVAIGGNPAHHGRYFYIQFNPRTYDIQMCEDLDLPDLKPFWKTLDEEGYRASIVDWYKMPVTPLENGVVMHRWFAHEPLTASVFHPPEMASVAAQYVEADPIAEGFASQPRDTAEKLQDFLDRLLQRVDIKQQFYADQLRQKDWDIYIACFGEAHNAGHYFIQLEDEGHALHDPEIASHVKAPLRQTYRKLDNAIGELIDAAGDDAQIFVLGGPGMGRFVSANGALEEICRRVDLGYEAPLSTAETAKKTYHSLVPETLRRRLGPLARAVKRQIAGSDFKKRRFFFVPHNDNSGGVRINLKGRERFGIIQRGPEYDALIEEITAGVSSFINPETGRSIVKSVVNVDKEFDGPHRDWLPDLFIEWDKTNTAANFSTLISEKFGEVSQPPHSRTGDHEKFGFFWAPAAYATETPQRPADITPVLMKAVRQTATHSTGADLTGEEQVLVS
ncbi:alkaline phosphatase family protein [Hyphococcus sp. DH-69]|uniref:alkaline phosphatase family protein n=1 Tax=Hyphococcus formosus TaxID=3143534 RepID=UPI00398BAA94